VKWRRLGVGKYGAHRRRPGPSACRFAGGSLHIWPPFAGVILMEAVKQTFAVRPKGRSARVPARARAALAPSPVGGKIAGPTLRSAVDGGAVVRAKKTSL